MRKNDAQAHRHVLIVKGVVKQYRKAFFEGLHANLQHNGVDLTVAYSIPPPSEAKKGDNIDLPEQFGLRIPAGYFWGERLLWQWPGWRQILRADLVIVVNANRNLLNVFLLLLSALGLKAVAFWGHGRNHQRAPGRSVREWIKQHLAKLPDWWFAYTADTARYLESVGFDPGKITTINNAVDTSGFARMVDAAREEDLAAMRDRLGLAADDRIALYCGALYSHKRIPLLIEACAIVAQRIPNFRLLIVGSGTEAHSIERACLDFVFLRYAGPMFGEEKSLCYRLSSLILNPGAVGLSILDAFAARLPVITLSDSLHGPEIGYLEHGVNGLLVDGDAEALAGAVVNVIESLELHSRLSAGAAYTARMYTIESMIERVRDGIVNCIERTVRPC